MNVKALRVDHVRQAEEPGAYEVRYLHGSVAGIGFRCPCGCGLEGWLPLRDRPGNADAWDWDGKEEAPTLSPSVLHRTCGWHGWLRNGEWVTA